MPPRFAILAFIAVAFGLYELWSEREVSRPPGIIAPAAPLQNPVADPVPPFEHRGWTIAPVADFKAQARVIGKAFYRWDATAGIAPVDLALAWGELSDSRVLADIRFSQHTRFLHYRFDTPPVAPERITNQTANVHVIPADATVERRLKAVRRGEVVTLEGWLVNASRSGRSWNTSLTRTDTGAGACEIMFVTNVSTR